MPEPTTRHAVCSMIDVRFLRFSTALALPLFVALAGCAADGADGANGADSKAPDAPATAAQPTEPARRPGAADVDGMVDGAPFRAADAVVFVGPLSTREPVRRGIRIVLASATRACAAADVVHAGDRTLTLEIEAPDGAALAAGQYTVPAPFGAGASSVYAHLDARSTACSSHGVVALTGGTVTIDASDAQSIRGSFELAMGHEKVRGTFDATPCDARHEPALNIRCEM